MCDSRQDENVGLSLVEKDKNINNINDNEPHSQLGRKFTLTITASCIAIQNASNTLLYEVRQLNSWISGVATNLHGGTIATQKNNIMLEKRSAVKFTVRFL